MNHPSLPRALREPGALDIRQMTLISDTADIHALVGHAASGSETYFQEPEIGLGIYRSTRHYLIGLQDPHLHEHERWLYVRSRNTDAWYRIGEDMGSLKHERDPLTMLAGTRYMAFGRHHVPSTTTPAEFAATYLTQWLLANPVEAAVVRPILLRLWDSPLSAADRHDLFYHYDGWLARHPEITGMPQELAQRMHGLGPLLDVQGLLEVPMGSQR